MSDYWLGVLTVPAVAVAGIAAWVLIRGLLWMGGLICVTVVRTTAKDMSRSQRATFAATAYAAEKGWFLAFGDFGFAVFVGQDVDARTTAYDRVLERATLRRFDKAEP